MAKNYTSKTSLEPLLDQPRRIVVDSILAFSKTYTDKAISSRALDLLKN